MQFQFLGQVSYAAALEAQALGLVLGFEADPVVTLGVRAGRDDVLESEKFWQDLGYTLLPTDRGGQATIHNPGQLVIFPTLDTRPWGARQFVNHLTQATRHFLEKSGVTARCRAGEPGLYTEKGKIMSVGLRIRRGVAHHGIAINIRNDLGPFAAIRVCGRAGASLDRLIDASDVGNRPLSELFLSWAEEFKAQLTLPPISRNLCLELPDVRS